jgi:hypothetical protein
VSFSAFPRRSGSAITSSAAGCRRAAPAEPSPEQLSSTRTSVGNGRRARSAATASRHATSSSRWAVLTMQKETSGATAACHPAASVARTVDEEQVLGPRALNRALLARQQLLARAPAGILETVEHLVGLQAQATLSPYLGLWSRLAGFDPHELGRLLEERGVVRLALMRGTVHLVSVRDACVLRPLVQVPIERGHQGAFGRRMGGAGPAAIAAAAEEELARGPLTTRDVARRLHERGMRADLEALGNAIRAHVPLVQVPPRGCGGRGAPRAARRWRTGRAGPSTRSRRARSSSCATWRRSAPRRSWTSRTGPG